MTAVQKLVTSDSFDARGVLVKAGHIGVFNTETLNGKEKHLKDVGDFEPARVEIAAIAPTGPNPQTPQQLPSDAVQGAGGQYLQPGKILVAEVTNPKEDRIDAVNLRDPDAEAKVTEALSDVMDTDPDRQLRDEARVDGTVKEITKDLGSKTDDELRELQTAERADKKRAGVLNAIQDELDQREKNAQS